MILVKGATTMNTTTDMTASTTILQQLGGSRFIAMTGASNFLGDTASLSFKLPRGIKTAITHVVVTLAADDTYTVEFLKCNLRAKVYRQVVAEVVGVYADNLQRVFTHHTGLDTHL